MPLVHLFRRDYDRWLRGAHFTTFISDSRKLHSLHGLIRARDTAGRNSIEGPRYPALERAIVRRGLTSARRCNLICFFLLAMYAPMCNPAGRPHIPARAAAPRFLRLQLFNHYFRYFNETLSAGGKGKSYSASWITRLYFTCYLLCVSDTSAVIVSLARAISYIIVTKGKASHDLRRKEPALLPVIPLVHADSPASENTAATVYDLSTIVEQQFVEKVLTVFRRRRRRRKG